MCPSVNCTVYSIVPKKSRTLAKMTIKMQGTISINIGATGIFEDLHKITNEKLFLYFFNFGWKTYVERLCDLGAYGCERKESARTYLHTYHGSNVRRYYVSIKQARATITLMCGKFIDSKNQRKKVFLWISHKLSHLQNLKVKSNANTPVQ